MAADRPSPADRPDLPRTTSFSDIDLRRWKEYGDVITDSLWLLGARDRSGPHAGDYWGNFVPQIPRQIIRRFTKRGEIVVDLFAGMGTTLIECRHLGRHGIGVELVPDVAARARQRIALAANVEGVTTEVLEGDSRLEATADAVRAGLAQLNKTHADCILLHPPYHDIIKFSDDPANLCNTSNVDTFLEEFGRVVAQAVALLAPQRFLALVIGDTYLRKEVVPLSFYCMQVCRQHGLALKGINVKDIQGNEKGKGQNGPLWRYRALSQGFYVFKHEYIFVFRKTARRAISTDTPGIPGHGPSLG